ncbi:unnamed protein product [Ambrosiozyma monospora]|uniref:Unnamed protein product n=1 Tax=Ambrosiozyma monospora TaxID=43982 RepID=A0ACB5UAF3_AMBMO|nr:unnamed protein product [Ambrosiozyma monospora]
MSNEERIEFWNKHNHRRGRRGRLGRGGRGGRCGRGGRGVSKKKGKGSPNKKVKKEVNSDDKESTEAEQSGGTRNANISIGAVRTSRSGVNELLLPMIRTAVIKSEHNDSG